MTQASIQPCRKCGASMPAAALNQVHVTCAYCGHVEVAPPPPPSAWLAQHNELIKPSVDMANQAHRLSNWMVRGYAFFIGAIVLVGLIRLLFN